MLTQEQGLHIAIEWVKAWNDHDIDAIMAHYSEEIHFASPLIIKIAQKPDGVITGKAELEAYFLKGLAAYPDLKFELYHVLTGVNSLVVYYKSVKNMLSAELMILDSNGKVKQCIAHYKEAVQ